MSSRLRLAFVAGKPVLQERHSNIPCGESGRETEGASLAAWWQVRDRPAFSSAAATGPAPFGPSPRGG